MKEQQIEQNKKHPGGRPLLFESVEELQAAIQSYFDICAPHPEEVTVYEYHKKLEDYETYNKKGEKVIKQREVDDTSREPYKTTKWVISQPTTPTITGLAVHLKTSRETLINYQERPEFFDTIKEAKDIIESEWEKMLQGSNVTGVIFNLKNNYKWQDKMEQDVTSNGETISGYTGLSTEELRKLAGK